MILPRPPKAPVLALVLVTTIASAALAARSPDFPPAKSAAAVKELISLFTARKIDIYGTHDADLNKWVAIKYVSGVQIFAVSATYGRPGDLEYFANHKDFTSLYESLRSSADETDRVIIDDAECNGLVAQPKQTQPNDDAVFGFTRVTFDGVFADAKHPDPKKPSLDDYLKRFTDADEQYTHIMTLVIDELKKAG